MYPEWEADESLERRRDAVWQELQRESELHSVRVASYSANLNGSIKRKYKQNKKLEEFKELFAKLQKAIVEEDYLEAARIRDKMYDLREKL